MKKHSKTCSLRNDNVAIYEYELGIQKIDRPENNCRFCNYDFSSQDSYNRHMRNGCKAKEKYEAELEQKVMNARAAVARGGVRVKGDVHGNIDNSYNTTNNNIININLPPLRAFGDENLDYITIKELVKELKKVKDVRDLAPMITNFTRLIHAHPAHPENHNVQISSLNAAHGRVYNGSAFENEDVVTIQDKILNKIGDTVMEKVEDTEINTEQVDNAITFKKREQILDVIDDEVVGEVGRTNSRKYRNNVKHVIFDNKNALLQTERAQIEFTT
jgi:hypothetical protein